MSALRGISKGLSSLAHSGSSSGKLSSHVTKTVNRIDVPSSISNKSARTAASGATRAETTAATATGESGLRTQRTLEGVATVGSVAAGAGVAVVGVNQARNFGERLLTDTEEGVASVGHAVGDGLGAALHSAENTAKNIVQGGSTALANTSGAITTVLYIIVPIVAIGSFAYGVYELRTILVVEGVAAVGSAVLAGWEIGDRVHDATKNTVHKVKDDYSPEDWEYILKNTGPVHDEDWGATKSTINTEVRELPNNIPVKNNDNELNQTDFEEPQSLPVENVSNDEHITQGVGGFIERSTPMQRTDLINPTPSTPESPTDASRSATYAVIALLSMSAIISFYLKFSAMYAIYLCADTETEIEQPLSDPAPLERPRELGGAQASTGDAQPTHHRTHVNAEPTVVESNEVVTQLPDVTQEYETASRTRSDAESEALHEFLSVHGDPNVDDRPPRLFHP
eukprot:2595042-Pleurochrysis_carterae.AAC.2